MKRYLLLPFAALSLLLATALTPARAEFAVLGCQPGGATPTAGPVPCIVNPLSPYLLEMGIIPGFADFSTTTSGFNVPTYSASLIEGVPAAAGTDVYCISGVAGKVVRIWAWDVSGTETTAGTIPVSININSAIDTGGTPGTAPTIIKHDTTDATAGATIIYYTANPTIGAATGSIRTKKLTLLAPATAVSEALVEFIFPHDYARKPIVLRGAAQQACLNWNAKTTAGNLIDSNITWTETTN